MNNRNVLAIVLLIYMMAISTVSFSQKNKQYDYELSNFLQFIRDSVLKNKQSILLQDYLQNKHMFGGTVLYGSKSHNGILTEAEKEEAIKQMINDSTKYLLSKTLIKRCKLVKDESSVEVAVWQFSKPIFLRDFRLCIFSFGLGDSQKTFLYKKVNGKWVCEKLIGEIANY